MSAKPVLAPEKLEDRLEFETLLADLSSRFVNLPADAVDSEIDAGADAFVLKRAIATDLLAAVEAARAESGAGRE